ncbi:9258_t:CDS:2, partial [Cetraspora pellucida]
KTTSTTVNYADTPNQAPSIRQPPTYNQNKLLEVLIKTTLAMIIEINLALKVEIITEIEVGHMTETTIDSTEPFLENVVEK